MKKMMIILTLILNLAVVPTVLAEEVSEGVLILDDFVVTASRYKELLSETSVSIDIITSDDIEGKNYENVGDLLRALSGVNINDNAGVSGAKTISIRGSASSQVLILIDGQGVNEIQGGGFDLGQLPTEQIERIEVLKGPTSAIYGANALGGVVNIITKRGRVGGETVIKNSFSSFSTKNYSIGSRNQNGGLGYSFNFNKKVSDGHRDNSHLNQENIFLRFDYSLTDSIDTRLSIQSDKADRGVPGSTIWPTPDARQEDELLNLNLEGQKRTDRSDLKLNLYLRDDDRRYEDQWGDSFHERRRMGANFNQTLYLPDNTIIYGLEVEEQRVESTSYNEEYKSINKAIFIQDKVNLSKHLSINLGGRYDSHGEYDSQFSPRAGLLYNLNAKVNLYSSVGKAYRVPTYDDLYWPNAGNPDLDPEEAVAYETGIRYLGERGSLELNLFRRDVDSLIKWAPTEEDPAIWLPDNIDSAKITGVELNLNGELTDNFSASLNYSYLDSRDEETQEQLEDYHRANLSLVYKGDLVRTNLGSRLVAGRKSLQSYFVTDIKFLRELPAGTDLSFGVNNLLDREYEVLAGYPMPERSYKVELIKRF